MILRALQWAVAHPLTTGVGIVVGELLGIAACVKLGVWP